MRKLLLSLICLLFLSGILFAGEVTLVSYDNDKRELVVKEGDKDSTYKVTDKTRVTFVDQSGNTKEGTPGSRRQGAGQRQGEGQTEIRDPHR